MLDFHVFTCFQNKVDSLASFNNDKFTIFLIIFKLKFNIFC